MPYLGNPPAEAYTTTVKDSFSGDGSTTAFTLSVPSTTNDLRVVVENVIQDPTVAYSVSGTTLTFTSAPPTGTTNIYAVNLGPAVQTVVPPDGVTLTNPTVTGDLTVDTDTLFVDSANNRVGVGTVSPSSLLDVDKSQDAETNIELTNTNTGSSAQVRTKYTTDGGLFTVGKTSDAHAFGGDAYLYNVDNTNIRFATNDIERLRILSSGGITFNGDTASANALDDYEEGTWTPNLPQGGSVTVTYASYIKVGALVTAYAFITATSIPNDGNQFQIGGLPFTSNSTNGYYGGGSLSYSGAYNTNVFTDPLVSFNSTFLYFHRNDGNSNAIYNSNITGGTRDLIFQVIYHTTI